MATTGYSPLEYAQALVQAAQEVASNNHHDSRDMIETVAESEDDMLLALFGAVALDLLMRSDPELDYDKMRDQIWATVKQITDD